LPLTKVDAQLLQGAINADSSGNVGIGTSSPASKLNIVDASETVNVRIESGSVVGQFFSSSAAGGVFLGSVSAHPLVFRTNITERMRIDTSGVITSTLGGMQVISGTAVTASGTSVDFTGIPSWVKRITVMFSGVSTSGTSPQLIQLGDSGGVETTGYLGAASTSSGTGTNNANFTTGIVLTGLAAPSAAFIFHGSVTITALDLANNLWACAGVLGYSSSAATTQIGGTKTLSATLDRVRITTVNGTDTFDAGTINILYE
jgi:hypothetical protein